MVHPNNHLVYVVQVILEFLIFLPLLVISFSLLLGLLEKYIFDASWGLSQQKRFYRWLGGIAPPNGTWLFRCLIDQMQQTIYEFWNIAG